MSEDRGQDRDGRLGAALRDLEVPDHRPGFGADLFGRLRAVRDRGPDLSGAGEDEAGGAAPPPVRPTPHTLSREPRRRPVPAHPARWIIGVAAVVAVMALVIVGVGLPGEGPVSPRAATAAEVRAAVATAWATTESIQGTLVFLDAEGRTFGQPEVRWTFILTARGDFRLTGITREEDLAFDWEENIERSWSRDGGMVFGGQRTGIAPGYPDPGPSVVVLDRALGAVVRALAAEDGGRVQEVTHGRRPAWLLDTGVRPNLLGPESPDHLQVTVDQQTGIPVKAVWTRGGAFVRETRIEELDVNGVVPPDAFDIGFPEGAEISTTDGGYRRVALQDLPSVVGYEPLTPGFVPEGYRLNEVAVSEEGSFTGAEGANPRTGPVVSLSYGRGLDRVIVTTRPIGADRGLWGDPLASGEGFVDRPEAVTFSGGALDGVAGAVLIDPLATPHVWAMTGDLVVTVGGNLTRVELIRVAESLA